MTNLAKNINFFNEEDFQMSLDWKETLAAKKLLDTLVRIIAEEYVEKAKQNPDIF